MIEIKVGGVYKGKHDEVRHVIKMARHASGFSVWWDSVSGRTPAYSDLFRSIERPNEWVPLSKFKRWAKRAVPRLVIFLDVDGVLNSERTTLGLGKRPDSYEPASWHLLDDVAAGLLRRVIRQTCAEVVLSSAWRTDCDVAALGARLGLPIIGITRPTYDKETRGQQIAEWIERNGPIDGYAIVDDAQDVLIEQVPRLVLVDGDEGFMHRDYRRLIEILEERTDGV